MTAPVPVKFPGDKFALAPSSRWDLWKIQERIGPHCELGFARCLLCLKRALAEM